MCDQHMKFNCVDNSSLYFEKCKCLFQEYDQIIANLETPVCSSNDNVSGEAFCFNMPIQFLQEIKKSGIEVLLTANNHCLDQGIKGLRETILNLNKLELKHVGTHLKKEDSFIVVQNDEMKIGLINFTYGTNAFSNHNYLDKDNYYMVDLLQKQELSNRLDKILYSNNSLPFAILKKLFRILRIKQQHLPVYERRTADKEQIKWLKETIRKCKREADLAIACFHVGGQYNREPSDYTKYITKIAIEEGVDIVVDNHEHVIHPIEKLMNVPVFYSLGNFLSSTGILRQPFDRFCNYSISANITLDTSNKKIKKVTFSIFKVIQTEREFLQVIPAHELYKDLNENDKNLLLSDVKSILELIYKCKMDKVIIQKEYPIMVEK